MNARLCLLSMGISLKKVIAGMASDVEKERPRKPRRQTGGRYLSDVCKGKASLLGDAGDVT